MSNQKIPPALQEEINQAQKLEEELQVLNSTIRVTKNNITEIESTIKELTETEDNVVVYKLVGRIFINSEKPKVLEDLKDDLSNLEMRLKRFERNYESKKQQFEELAKKINQKIQTQSQA
ncbi:MAG: prefoldin subunit [Candidatus Lokiarchaeota archaeon]|nr:prefoldin subunit [Candidatus Lokiarchaeota archaeon]